MDKSEVTAPIFMIGMGRSGTTAISEALALHNDLGWFSVYIEHFPSLPCLALMDRISDIPKIGWYLRGKKKQNEGLISLVRKYLPYPSETYSVWERFCGEKFSFDYLIGQTASEEEMKNITNYIHTILRYQGKRRFFAKFTGPPRIHYLNSIFPDAYYIHMVRDPRAVISSLINFWKEWKELGGLERPWWRNGLPDEYVREWEESGRSTIVLAAVQWKRVVELTWEEKRLVPPKNYMEIKYEDFVDNPHHVLSMVFERNALEDSLLAHRYISSIGKLRNMNLKYKKYLSSEDIDIVEKITGDTAKRAGYDFIS